MSVSGVLSQTGRWMTSGVLPFAPSGPALRAVQIRSRRICRTTEGVSQQIYSLPPLAAWVSLRIFVDVCFWCPVPNREVDDFGRPALRPFGASPAGCSNSFQTNLSNHRRRKPADLQSAPV